MSSEQYFFDVVKSVRLLPTTGGYIIPANPLGPRITGFVGVLFAEWNVDDNYLGPIHIVFCDVFIPVSP